MSDGCAIITCKPVLQAFSAMTTWGDFVEVCQLVVCHDQSVAAVTSMLMMLWKVLQCVSEN